MPGTHGPGCGCVHEAELTGAKFLLPFIDKEAIEAFNEQISGSAKSVFKSYSSRLDETKHCDSEFDDPELLINIPFTSPCKVTSFHLIGGENGHYPSKVKLYVNQDNLDFSELEDRQSTQELDLFEDYHGAMEYPLKISQFNNVNRLTMYFPDNQSGDYNRLYYIGLRGESSNLKRQPIITVYEAMPNVADHKTSEEFTPQFTL